MFSVFVFLFGLIIGSFLNAVIYRLKTKESVLMTCSHCPKCGVILKWYDLIPLLSFILQRGLCRYCGKKISWQYPIVEIATASLFLLIFNFLIFNQFSIYQFLNIFYYLIIVCFLIIIFVYDLKHYIIPDKVVYPAIIISLIFNFNFLIFNQFSIYQFLILILGAFSGALFFLLLVVGSGGKWMGMGDVKLAVLMGLVLGWPNILWALFLAFLSGAIIGLVLIAFKIKTLKSQIPFGPFLSGATILVMLFGESLTKVFNWFILF